MSKNKKNSQSKWDDTYYVTAYLQARGGDTVGQIGKSFGVRTATFQTWLKRYPALGEAIERGHRDGGYTAEDGITGSWANYVYQQLPQDLRDVWDKIQAAERLDNQYEQVEHLLAKGGKYFRQSLFIHALAVTNFNVSRAMKMLNVSRKTYHQWRNTDPGFSELIDELNWHKDNFFEEAFINRVRAGDTAAILHAVKSRLGARGYSDKIQVEHTGTVDVNHRVCITQLDLPLEVKAEVLDALEAHELATRKEGGPTQ